MSLNSQIRKIPLLSNCDFSRFNADIHNYEGFCECNSLFLNKRLTPWLKRAVSENELLNGFTWETNENNFDIYKDGEYKFSVSRQYYKDEVVSEKSGTEAVNPVSDTDTYHLVINNRSWVTGFVNRVDYGSCDNLCSFVIDYNSSTQFLVIVKNNTLYTYDGVNNLRSTVSLPTTVSNSANAVSFKWVTSAVSQTLSGPNSLSRTISIPAKTLLITIGWNAVSNYMDSYFNSNTASYALSVSSEGVVSLIEASTILTGDVTLSTTDEYLLKSESSSILPADAIYTVADKICYFAAFETISLQSPLYTYKEYIWEDIENSAAATVFSLETDTATVRNNLTVKTEHLSSGAVSITFSYDTYSASGTYRGRSLSQAQNYSKKFGTFAINYVGGEAANIAHEYKKLIDFSQFTPESIYYDSDAIYYDKDDEIHKVSIATAESPIYKAVGEYYLIFNTTTYKNAYIIPYEKQVCSCDDWNNRVFWSTTKQGDFGLIASRYGNNWQTTKELITPSAQYAALTSEIAKGTEVSSYYKSDPSAMFASFLDYNYTCPSDVQYEVFFPDYIAGTTSYSQYKQGYIKAPSASDYSISNGFTVEHDTSKIWSETEDLQDNPALLSSTFLIFGSNYYTDINDAIYSLLNYPLHSQLPALVFLITETAESYDSDFLIFVINGQQYTYYPITHKIYDSNDSWVADTQLFYYIGYTTKAAYFYNVFDKGIYLFTGDNAMQKVLTLEKYSVVTSSMFTVNSLTIPSMSLIILNLTDRLGILYDDQCCVLDIGETIDTMRIDSENGIFTINDTMYSLIGSYYDDWEQIPIRLETEFYGDGETEQNTINDTIYVTVDNLSLQSKGTVKFSFKTLSNNKLCSFAPQTVHLTPADFNEKNTAQIKVQPQIQECRGFKVEINSDFEISELKIGTSQGAVNQTTKRI